MHPTRLVLALAPLVLADQLAAPLAAQCELQALKGQNTRIRDFFGKSCALDGERLVVGAFAATTDRPGSAHVFELQGDVWVQVARLLPSDGGAGDEFGNSVGISGDALIVGSESNDNEGGSNAGAAYVFERDAAGRWLEVQKLQPHDAERSHHFGEYVAIEGTVAVAGCRFDSERGNNAGAAYVFERGADGRWVETAKLIGSGARRNDLSADTLAIGGGRIVISSYRSDASGGHSGSAYLFEKVAGTWTEVAHLVALDGAGELSRGVAIDGDRVVLGARLESSLGDAAGAGYVFEKVGGTWQQTAKLLPRSGRALDWIGEAVAVRGDRIVLSGHHHDQVGSNSGVAFVFEFQNGAWVETKMLQSSTASPNDEFSFALALSGERLLATAPFDGGNVGAAFVFTFQPELCACGGTGGGTVTPFGENLGGANIGRLASASAANPGTTMVFEVTGVPGGTTGTLFLSPTAIKRAAFGGTLLVPPAGSPIKLPFRMNAGSATVTWRVPQGLCGAKVFAQATVLDPTQPLGRALTNGLELVIGD
jgi:hypothetical protein